MSADALTVGISAPYQVFTPESSLPGRGPQTMVRVTVSVEVAATRGRSIADAMMDAVGA